MIRFESNPGKAYHTAMLPSFLLYTMDNFTINKKCGPILYTERVCEMKKRTVKTNHFCSMPNNLLLIWLCISSVVRISLLVHFVHLQLFNVILLFFILLYGPITMSVFVKVCYDYKENGVVFLT